jgi:hypothetical protein
MFSAVQRQQRKSDVMTSFGLTACSAVYYQVPHLGTQAHEHGLAGYYTTGILRIIRLLGQKLLWRQ